MIVKIFSDLLRGHSLKRIFRLVRIFRLPLEMWHFRGFNSVYRWNYWLERILSPQNFLDEIVNLSRFLKKQMIQTIVAGSKIWFDWRKIWISLQVLTVKVLWNLWDANQFNFKERALKLVKVLHLNFFLFQMEFNKTGKGQIQQAISLFSASILCKFIKERRISFKS